LADLKQELVVVDLSDHRVIDAYAEINTLAKRSGWATFNDKNDLWIAAATRVSATTLLTTDRAAFEPLRDGDYLEVVLIDARTGARLEPSGKRRP
jgi:predicted nucleic acid-binding protein